MKTPLRWAFALWVLVLVPGVRVWAHVPTNDDCIACHSKEKLRSRTGGIRFIDPGQFAQSAHSRHGVSCLSCHEGITAIDKESRRPHRIGIEPKCIQCHGEIDKEYSKSLHAKVSKKICYSCHNPHYAVSFRQLTADARKNICLKCHDAERTHLWLPQKDLHFSYLECTTCHALKAEIGLLFFIVDRNEITKDHVLRYEQFRPALAPHNKSVVETLDSDGSGDLSDEELHQFMTRLQQEGIPGAALEARILVVNPSHNFTSKGTEAKDCTLCHSRVARFYSKVVLGVPEKDGDFRTVPVQKGILARRGQRPFMGDLYLLGESKIRKEDLDYLLDAVRRIGFRWLDLFGLYFFISCFALVLLHAALMYATRRLRTLRGSAADFESLPGPTRFWHWVHGLCVTFLLVTGIQLRLPDVAPIFATFLNAVNLHNICGIVLIVDYLFWLAFHLYRREFKERFLISPGAFFRDTSAMLQYYGHLIFIGEDYPSRCEKYFEFDPVERVFFMTVMLVFLPIQIITGILLFDVQAMMPAIRILGGLRIVDAIHLLVGYFLVSSMIIHVYFHTLKKYRIKPRTLAARTETAVKTEG